jgi:hypothetical protein
MGVTASNFQGDVIDAYDKQLCHCLQPVKSTENII